MDALATILGAAGFKENPPTEFSLGRSFIGKKIGDWCLSAYFYSGAAWQLDLTIKRSEDTDGFSVGTRHRFYSLEALERGLDQACTSLARLAADPSVLLCPDCGTRYVHVKERNRDGRPFLSCSGMTVETRRVQGVRVKYNPCRGTSNKIPAQVEYR